MEKSHNRKLCFCFNTSRVSPAAYKGGESPLADPEKNLNVPKTALTEFTNETETERPIFEQPSDRRHGGQKHCRLQPSLHNGQLMRQSYVNATASCAALNQINT